MAGTSEDREHSDLVITFSIKTQSNISIAFLIHIFPHTLSQNKVGDNLQFL